MSLHHPLINFQSPHCYSSSEHGRPREPQKVRQDPAQRFLADDLAISYTTIVRVFVGTDKREQPFLVYPSVLTKSSRVLQVAVPPASRWQEKSKQDIHFPLLDSKQFEMYIHWLHGNPLHIQHQHQDEKVASRLEQLEATGAYNLGVQLKDFKFQNTAIKAMVAILTRVRPKMFPILIPSPHCMESIYTSTHGNTNMRRMLVQFLVVHGSQTVMEDYRSMPPAFHHEVNIALLKLRNLRSYKGPEENIDEYLIREC